MTPTPVCPHCGKPLASDAPHGLCPECLLKAALPGQSVTTGLHTTPSPASADQPKTGVRLRYFGDYELIEEIACGGMGVVWKARQTSLNRIVALKMMRAGSLARADEVGRFLREAEAAANLQHPNIVAIHEVGEHDGEHYFSMDYVAGRDLGALVREGPLSAQRAARYVKIIAEAIHFAHQRGTLHRDLKPQNVLIDEADQPRITDFGLAKFVTQDSGLTQPGVVMGSPSYMPPEQADGRHGEIGPHSDVYSLGAMLYELLTGRPPFRAATVRATLREVIDTEPTAPRRLKSDVPPDLETICLKCLEKSVVLRYHSARELAEDLDRFLRGAPILARPAGPLRRAVSWGWRHPGILGAAAALVMLGLAFASFYLVEENAYLRAVHASRVQEREPDPSSLLYKVLGGPPWREDDPQRGYVPRSGGDSLLAWLMLNLFVTFAGFFVLLEMYRRARRITWNELFDPTHLTQPRQPLGEGMQRFAVGTALVCMGSGVLFLVKIVKVQVWEGHMPYANYLGVFCSVYSGLLLAGAVVRDYRLTHRGAASRHLSADQTEGIRQALEESDLAAAIKLYQQVVPDAGFFESEHNVRQLFPTLCPETPNTSVPPLSLNTLNWRAVILCAVIGGTLVGAACFSFPPAAPATVLGHFATGLLFGMGYFASLRVEGYWKQLLPLIPALAMMVWNQAFFLCSLATGSLFGMGLAGGPKVKGFWRWSLLLVPALAMLVFTYSIESGSTDVFASEVIWPNVIGLIFGIGLVISASRRREGDQKS